MRQQYRPPHLQSSFGCCRLDLSSRRYSRFSYLYIIVKRANCRHVAIVDPT